MSQPYGGIQRPYKMDESCKNVDRACNTPGLRDMPKSCEVLVRKNSARGGRLNVHVSVC